MNRIKKILHRNIKLVIILIIFIAIGAGVTYSATTYLYNSNVIGYDNSNSELSSTNVKDAIDEIYDSCNSNTDCPAGYTCHEEILPSTSLFKPENAVLDNIASTYVNSATGINFINASSDTNGKGLYIRNGTENDAYPIYYFRGAIDNNNVIFADYCWQIVRTTETGGIKLLYNGIANDSQCLRKSAHIGSSIFNNNSLSASEQVKYTYELNGATNDSQMKIAIDSWYASNMISYTSYLEDTIWCNDTAGNSYSRATTGAPSINCQALSDSYTVNSSNGNGKLTYPVGLLTVDELLLAGATAYSSNNTYYLGNAPTMSEAWPGGGTLYRTHTFGELGNNYAYYTFDIRPAISLKQGIGFSYGNGTAKNPYVIK